MTSEISKNSNASTTFSSSDIKTILDLKPTSTKVVKTKKTSQTFFPTGAINYEEFTKVPYEGKCPSKDSIGSLIGSSVTNFHPFSKQLEDCMVVEGYPSTLGASPFVFSINSTRVSSSYVSYKPSFQESAHRFLAILNLSSSLNSNVTRLIYKKYSKFIERIYKNKLEFLAPALFVWDSDKDPDGSKGSLTSAKVLVNSLSLDVGSTEDFETLDSFFQEFSKGAVNPSTSILNFSDSSKIIIKLMNISNLFEGINCYTFCFIRNVIGFPDRKTTPVPITEYFHVWVHDTSITGVGSIFKNPLARATTAKFYEHKNFHYAHMGGIPWVAHIAGSKGYLIYPSPTGQSLHTLKIVSPTLGASVELPYPNISRALSYICEFKRYSTLKDLANLIHNIPTKFEIDVPWLSLSTTQAVCYANALSTYLNKTLQSRNKSAAKWGAESGLHYIDPLLPKSDRLVFSDSVLIEIISYSLIIQTGGRTKQDLNEIALLSEAMTSEVIEPLEKKIKEIKNLNEVETAMKNFF